MPGLVYFSVAFTALLSCDAFRLETSLGAESASAEGLLACAWGQRWALAMYAPLNPHPTDAGTHERLGCNSNTLAQVMHHHRRCPVGSVEYTVPGFEATGMDFDAESADGLCDWSRFAARSQNVTTDAGTAAVARYIYTAALVVRRNWGSPKGTPHYLLSHEEQDAEVSEHYGMAVSRFHIKHTTAAREEAEELLAQEIDAHRPVIAFLINEGGHLGHLVVLDGLRRAASGPEVHVNAGHDGFDNGWYDFHGPMCFKHYNNGTSPADGGCAHRFSHVSYLKFIRPITPV